MENWSRFHNFDEKTERNNDFYQTDILFYKHVFKIVFFGADADITQQRNSRIPLFWPMNMDRHK